MNWCVPAVATLGIVLLVATLAWQLVSFVSATVSWAERDLSSRTAWAARTLDEPLRTQNFARVHEIGERCRAEGFRLRIISGPSGIVFDTQPQDEPEHRSYVAEEPCGDYRVVLTLPARHVLRPLVRAAPLVLLALLLGAASVLIFFVLTYRQHVRIQELARLEQFRREFIADFSHELKTPLTGILGAAEMLPGPSPLVDMIRRESNRLNELAQNVLDLARLERTDAVLNRAETDMADLVQGIVELRRPTAQAAGCRLTFAPPDETRIVAAVDAQQVAHAVANLVDNAIRHAQAKEISVSLTHDGNRLRIMVADDGIGIAESERERIFERFHRVDPARAAETGGAGLGLAIVRRIARLHGGDAHCESNPPHGCIFTLTMPCAVRPVSAAPSPPMG